MKRLLVVVLLGFMVSQAAGDILHRSTLEKYEGDPYPWNTPGKWTRDPDNALYVRAEGEPTGTYQTQAHGGFGLYVNDPDDQSYANASHAFPDLGMKPPEYMVEFYFYLDNGAAGDVHDLYLYRPTRESEPADITIELVAVTDIEYVTDGDYWMGTWVLHIEDDEGTHEVFLGSVRLDSWHRLQMHRHGSMDLWVDGDSIGSYDARIGGWAPDTFLIGTVDTGDDGEAFWDDFIVTTVPDGEHPRLFFDQDYVDDVLVPRTTDDNLGPLGVSYKDMWIDDDRSLKNDADAHCTEESWSTSYYPDSVTMTHPYDTMPPFYPNTCYDDYWQFITFKLGTYLQELGFAYALTEDTKYADAARDIIFGLAKWSSWTNPYFFSRRPYAYFDLGHLTIGCALAYDMIFNGLSNYEKMSIQNTIVVAGIGQLFLASQYENNHRIPFAQPNMMAVDMSAMGFACLALDTNALVMELDTARTRVIDSLLNNPSICDTNGGWAEGISYAAVACEWMIPFLDAMGREDLFEDNSFLTDYPLMRIYCTLPGADTSKSQEWEVNFCDHDYRSKEWNHGIFALASYNNDELIQWYLSTRHLPLDTYELCPFYPFLWYDNCLSATSPSGMSLELGRLFPNINWAVLRTGWEDTDYLLALKCGYFGGYGQHVSHNHRDQNGFVFGTNGEWLIADWGYARTKPDNRMHRESYSDFHNVILVNGSISQEEKMNGYVAKFVSEDMYGYTLGDASNCYSELSTWHREIVTSNQDGYFVVFDNIVAQGAPVDLKWLLHAFEEQGDNVTTDEQSIITIERVVTGTDKECLHVKLLTPAGRIIEVLKPYEDHDRSDLLWYEWTEWHDEMAELPDADPEKKKAEAWRHIEVSLPNDVSSAQFLSVFYPYDDGESPPSISKIDATTGNMEGALVGDDIVLFGESVMSVKYIIPECDESYSVLAGLWTNTAYTMVSRPHPPPDWLCPDSITDLTSTGAGTISFLHNPPSADGRHVWIIRKIYPDFDVAGGYHGHENWSLAENSEISGYHIGIDTFTVAEGCTVSVIPYDGGDSTGILLIDAQVVNISGVLTANGAGYGSGEGAGTGTQGGFWDGAGGAGFGGTGGSGQKGKTGGTAYSSPDTCRIGSGGGYGGHANAKGGPGGGAIRIECVGTVTITGTVSSDGKIGNGYFGKAGGGGSGGSVWISGQTLNGSGHITAQGGPGKTISNTHSGAGAGGRVRIEYTNSNYTGEISASGGTGPELATDGQFGTIRVQQANDDASIFISPVHNNTGPHSKEGSITAEFKDAWVRLSANDSILGNVEITAKDSIVVASNGMISGTEKGYGGGSGSGQGEDGDLMKGAGGGAYGGVGGDGHTGKLGGSPYGSHSEPCSLGSGGGTPDPGNYPYNYGGFGGGRVKLDCPDGIIKIDGVISVDGGTGETVGNGRAGGGGSGGSIWIVADKLEGTGIVSADGGPGAYSTDDAGGGSGGRIHVSYRDSSFVGRLSVTGGTGHGRATDGQFGTIFIEQINDSVEILVSPVHDNTGPHSREGLVKSIELSDEYVRLSANDSILGNVAITASDSIVIASNSIISADYKGYGGGDGTGTGQGGDMLVGGGGAGYGGSGGDGSGTAGTRDGGCSYGEECSPCSLGSGGGDPDPGTYPLYYGGFGGGRIKLKSMGGTIKINGTLTAAGGLGETYGSGCLGGGGSGGSICLTANKIEGTGSIMAEGGDGHTNGTTQSGSGGGGRVCLARTTDDFSGPISAAGGTAPGDAAGDSGTVCLTTPSGGGCQSGGEIEIDLVPTVFRLYQNAPNPCTRETVIRYGVPEKANISLRIFDLSGRCVATLVNGERKIGYHTVTLDTRNLGAGVYFARFVAGGEHKESKKIVLTR